MSVKLYLNLPYSFFDYLVKTFERSGRDFSLPEKLLSRFYKPAAKIVGSAGVIWLQVVPFHIQMPPPAKSPYTSEPEAAMNCGLLAVIGLQVVPFHSQMPAPAKDPYNSEPAADINCGLLGVI
jgi:hypothetical protein